MNEKLRQVARELLEQKKVGVVIGYALTEADPNRTTPVFVQDPRDTEKLVWNPLCVNNLTVYLTKKKPEIKSLGKPAIVAKGCDVRSILGLIKEFQLKREDVVIIGVACEGVVRDFKHYGGGLSKENIAQKCLHCKVRTPTTYDYLIGEEVPPVEDEDPFLDVKELESKPVDERRIFWKEQFEKCIRCYACRQVCPFCYCDKCIADKTMPRWIEPSAHERGNFAWNVIRAMHLAGRCIACGECSRVCPADIPLDLLNREVEKEIKEKFNYVAGMDTETEPPLRTYSEEDDDSWIR
jgi:formate dehydrogenase subunit beta